MTVTRNACLLLLFAVAGCQSGPLSGVAWNPFSPPERTSYKTPAVRIEEAYALGEQATGADTPEQQQVVVELARQIQVEPDPLVREEIVKAAARFNTALAGQVLRAGLNDPDPVVRTRCCKLIGSRADPGQVAVLADTLRNDTDLDVRIEAVRALGEIRSPETAAALIPALESDDPGMQFAGVRSMGLATGRDFSGDVRACLAYAKGEAPATPQGDGASVATRLGRFLPF